MSHSNQHDVSLKNLILSNTLPVRLAAPYALVAAILALAIGCFPAGPPSAAQIFSPGPGHFFQQTSGDVSVTGLAGAICYTTDGSFPSYGGGSCTGGTTQSYSGNIQIACGAGESGTQQKTVRIVYLFNGVETFSTAGYSLLCPIASNVKVFSVVGDGLIIGDFPGTVSVSGSAALNTDTGVLEFNFLSTSVTAFTHITAEESGTITGTWANPLLTLPVGTTTSTKCTNNGGLANACDYVVLDTPSDMGITLDSDPIDYDLSVGGVTEFSIFVARVPPAIPVAADTSITYTLTTLGSGAESTWYPDADGDGFGDATMPLEDIIQPNGYVVDATDCDDSDASRFPGNPEVCDAVDNDCDSIVPVGEADDDGDNYLACSGFVSSSDPSVLGGDDCNDDAATGAGINPGATETADLVDEDCDGEVDNGFKYIFVTSTPTTGNLAQYDTDAGLDLGSTGLEGGDEFCQDHADGDYGTSVVPTGTYRAWLSDPTAHALYRQNDAGFPYVNLVGEQIAANRAGLGTMLFASIKYHESGTEVDLGQAPQVWTGTKQNGTIIIDQHCNGWTDGTSASTGMAGWPGYLNQNWTQWAIRDCDNTALGIKLYCIQQ